MQVNTPYPSGAYLSAFFRSLGHDTYWYDLNQAFFHEIFSEKGLSLLFDKTQDKALSMAESFEKKGDTSSAFELRRYVMQRRQWETSIEAIKAILGADKNGSASREECHRFIFSPHRPQGMRMENFLSNLDHEATVDDARFLASFAIADIADYITAVFDREFSLIRYAEHLTVSESSFKKVEESLSSPVLETYLEKVLEVFFAEHPVKEKTLVCISIPFAGTFTSALYTGRFVKEHFPDLAFVSMGGGFINTELRETEETGLSTYTDSLSYDRGYGSYLAFFDALKNTSDFSDLHSLAEKKSFYKLRLISKNRVSAIAEHDSLYEKKEDELTKCLVPDFTDIDFSRYLSMSDDTNPMQRLWTDGRWIKAYLAYGCYWHRCAFCDVTLDYVASYRTTKVLPLYASLKNQSEKKGVRGIHFVDEALPPRLLSDFAFQNALCGSPLSFWGNVRFEKSYNRDTADFLSYGGLTAVSGGIEIATGKGLASINKGTDINSIVASCCAFKEAGILVHAYMIYGWWEDGEQEIINSMEVLRQFYQAGLLDSSFWHKFVLTRHSKVYDEWKRGMHPSLQVIENSGQHIFAKNTLHFKGEEKSEKYGKGLNAALSSWMHGEKLNTPVGKWFSFKTVEPTIKKDFIQKAIEAYEEKRDQTWKNPLNIEKAHWLGGMPVLSFAEKEIILFSWYYMQEARELSLGKSFSKEKASLLKDFLLSLSPSSRNEDRAKKIYESFSDSEKKLLSSFRGQGLVEVSLLESRNLLPED